MTGGGWGDLRAILAETRHHIRPPGNLCPVDAFPLRQGPGGILYCPFDGWRGTASQAEWEIPPGQGYGTTVYGDSGYGS